MPSDRRAPGPFDSSLAWLTDIHLNFLEPDQDRQFIVQLAATPAEAFLMTGDISHARDVPARLADLDEALQRPIYFVLGNHDFYGGSIRQVRQEVRQLCLERPRLHYLTGAMPIALRPAIGLVGHDGWADARLGDYEHSLVMMNDYRLIEELAGMNKRQRWPVLKAMGDQSAAELRESLAPALAEFPEVWVATHLPPLREACWHEGQISDDEWAPHFTCKAIGDLLLELAETHRERRIVVYCGHTHSNGVIRPLPNLTIHTGGAVYGQPRIEKLIPLPSD